LDFFPTLKLLLKFILLFDAYLLLELFLYFVIVSLSIQIVFSGTLLSGCLGSTGKPLKAAILSPNSVLRALLGVKIEQILKLSKMADQRS
jgi:hypothetical protein